MPLVYRRRAWEMAEAMATPEEVYLNRRKFMAMLGLGAIGVVGGSGWGATAATRPAWEMSRYPAKRNEKYKLDRALSEEREAGQWINYYEYTVHKSRVATLARKFKPTPWAIQIGGLVKKEKTIDLEDLLKRMTLEERLYRHRCVEAWSMAVPWTGFPLKDFIDLCDPLGSAKFVRFISVSRPEEMPGMREQPGYPWPYFEGLSMTEATNELAMMVCGIYGHALPNHHGAPIRVVVPWKYGYKSPKAIVRVEFVEQQPLTFWSQLQPVEYPFESNVNPNVPHPRWSQATERVIGTERRVKTLMYNGYGDYVAHLYK